VFVATERTFADRLTELRKEKGLTQSQLARAAGYSRQYIFQLEHGAAQPTWETAKKLARALGVRVQDFDPEEEPPAPEPPPAPRPRRKR
jgi:putative transcriptional regulator